MTRIEFLGTGTSHGIPVIGCSCPVCMSADPHDKRWRSSILITKDDTAVVIDTGYEFRLQALRAGITHLDGVLYTHQHSDHMMGLDDLRVFTDEHKLPVYGFPKVLADAERIFPYAFHDMPYKGVPRLEKHELKEHETFSIGSLSFTARGKRSISQRRSPITRAWAVKRASPRLLPAVPGNDTSSTLPEYRVRTGETITSSIV